eukprot:2493184-Prymnesium_polylepis.1
MRRAPRHNRTPPPCAWGPGAPHRPKPACSPPSKAPAAHHGRQCSTKAPQMRLHPLRATGRTMRRRPAAKCPSGRRGNGAAD